MLVMINLNYEHRNQSLNKRFYFKVEMYRNIRKLWYVNIKIHVFHLKFKYIAQLVYLNSNERMRLGRLNFS